MAIMKKTIYFSLFIGVLFTSCIKDNSTMVYPESNPNFSAITITSPTERLSVDHGQEFVFTPAVTQKIGSKELQYIWTANYIDSDVVGEIFSVGEGATLRYTFPKFGTYRLRLEAKNEDYSAFKTWEIDVRVYDAGYFIVGKDDAGNSNISFARSLSQTDVLEGKTLTFIPELFNKVNPEHQIKDVVAIAKSLIAYGKNDAYLHVFTKEKIYVANPNTFEIFNVIEFTKQFPGEYIEKVTIFDTYITASRIFTSKGRILSYDKAELFCYRNDAWGDLSFDNAYTNLVYGQSTNVNGDEVVIDEANSKLWVLIYYHNNSKPVNNTSGTNASQNNFGDNYRPNVYNNMDILNVFRMNGNSTYGTPTNLFTLATDRTNPLLVKFVEFTFGSSTGMTTIAENVYEASGPITYKKGAQIVPNARYSCAYYADGSNVYVWYPNNTVPNNRLPETPSFNIGSGKVITTMSVSYDMKQLYVGFYDQNSSHALKGGLYIYDCSKIGQNQSLQPDLKFENITTRPVQVLYKSNVWDKFVSN
ncbi:MAG: hypothetical protein EOM61_07090 [Bacteroidia bacterium]|nr:hypothetical protein [Bacteroidia bacterium]